MKLTCENCSLKKHGCFPGMGNKQGKVLVVMERMTPEALEQQVCISTDEFRRIKTYFASAGLPTSDAYFTNVLKGYIEPKHALSKVPFLKCQEILSSEIEEIKPKVIVLCGRNAYKHFKANATTGTTYYEGAVNAWLVYTHHVYKTKIDPIAAQEFIEHLKKAKELVDTPSTAKPVLEAPEVEIINEPIVLKSLLTPGSEWSADIESTGLSVLKDKALVIGFANDTRIFGTILNDITIPVLQECIKSIKIIGQNWKFDAQLLRKAGIIASNLFFDTRLAYNLLYPKESAELEAISLKLFGTYFGHHEDMDTLFKDGITPELLHKLSVQAGQHSFLTWNAYKKLQPSIDAKWKRYFYDTFVPTSMVLSAMEYAGVMIDEKAIEESGTLLEYDIKSTKAELLASPEIVAFLEKKHLTELNFNSPKQLSELIYGHLKLKPIEDFGKTTKEEALIKLGATTTNPVFGKLIKYRGQVKLYDTYINKLKTIIETTGTNRIHPELHQDVCATGRLSCSSWRTPVKTNRGIVKIKDIQIGDYVYTHKLRWRKVTKKGIIGKEKMFKVVFNDGLSMDATGKHEFLLSNGRWATVKEIYNELLKSVDKGRVQYSESSRVVPLNRMSSHTTNCFRIRNYLSQCAIRFRKQFRKARIQCTQTHPMVTRKNGIAESYVSKNRRKASQLERYLLRLQRILYSAFSWSSDICTSYCCLQSTWASKNSSGDGSTPYRQKPRQQCYRESCLSYQKGTQTITLFTEKGLPQCTIKEIKPTRSYKVYDITVEEDHSYLSCNVFSHNSRNPNLQTIPKKAEGASIVRQLFCAPPGYVLFESDLAQVEFRMLIHLSRDKNMSAMINSGFDVHTMMASKVYKVDIDKVTPHQRDVAKTISFGLIYGMSESTLARRTGMTEEEAIKIKSDFFALFPDAAMWIQQVQKYGLENKKVFTCLGREIALEFDENDPKQFSKVRRWAVNYPIQSASSDFNNLIASYVLKDLDSSNINAKLVLIVHDAIIAEVKEEDVDRYASIVEAARVKANAYISARVPFAMSMSTGKNLASQQKYTLKG